MTSNDLEHQFTAVVSVMRFVTNGLRLELRCFHYKVPLHLSYPHIQLDDEI